MKSILTKTVNGRWPAFTLIDLLVATSIIVTISVVIVVNFRVGRQRDELRNTGLLLASLIHQAQAYTLAGRTVAGVYPAGGYAISIDTNTNYVYLFANEFDDRAFTNGGELWQEDYNLSDSNVEIITPFCIDFGGGCDYSFAAIEYFFLPPAADRSILGYTPNQGKFEIILRHTGLAGKGIRLTGNAVTGQVILGSIEDIP